MQIGLNFAIFEEIVNFLHHNCVLKIKNRLMSSDFFTKWLDRKKKSAIIFGNYR
jgi:hypothetical protein